jgi:hypothetical protein
MAYSRTGIRLWPFGASALVFEVAFHLNVLAAVVAAAHGALGASALFGLAALAVPVALQVLRRKQGAAPVRWRVALALPLVLWLTPLLFVKAWLARAVEWRGPRYVLDVDGRIAVAARPRARVRRRRAAPGGSWRRGRGSRWPRGGRHASR